MRGIVGADRDAGEARKCGGTGELAGADHLVADQDVRHPAPGQRLGFGDLLHALAHGAAADLLQRHDGGFMRLGMGAQLHAGALDGLRHRVQVVFEGIEVDQQGGGIDLVLAHAGAGGGRLQHAV